MIVALLVMPSVLEAPVSSARAAVSVGGVESRTMVWLKVAVKPPVMVAVAVKALLPLATGIAVNVKLPELSAVTVPRLSLALSVRVTEAFGEVTPTRLTLASSVSWSPTVPVSLAESRSKVGVPAGTAKVKLTFCVVTLPAASVAWMLRVWAPAVRVPPEASELTWVLVSAKLPDEIWPVMVSGNVPLLSRPTSSEVMLAPVSLTVPATAGSLVMPSVDELPLSSERAAVSVGGVVSSVMVCESVAVRPAESVAVMLKVLAPADSVMPVKVKAPLLFAVTVWLGLPRTTVAFASVTPTRVTVAKFVR